MFKNPFHRGREKLPKDHLPMYKLARCYICTITMLNSSQSTTPFFLEKVSKRGGKNHAFWTLNLVPIPLLSADVSTSPEILIVTELKVMLQEADFRIVASLADVKIGSFGSIDNRVGFGIIGNPVDNLLKATLSLPNTSSWISSDIADAVGSPHDAEQLVGGTSFFRVR
jgi:hypothetical protein